MPLYRRLPKRGFNNIFAKDFNAVSLARIQAAIDAKKLDAKETVDAAALIKAGVIRRAKDGVRLLADGELKAKVAFDVAGASKAAIEKIEKAGGSVKLPEGRSRRVRGGFTGKSAYEAAAAFEPPLASSAARALISWRPFPRRFARTSQPAERAIFPTVHARSGEDAWHRLPNNLLPI